MIEKIRVAVVDDHPLFREGVAHTLSNAPDIEVVGTGSSGKDALRLAQDLLPDLMLLDVNMPGGGIDAVRSITQTCPVVKLIMLSVSENLDHVSDALQAGAKGYILKQVSGSDLVNTVRGVQAGDSYVTPALAARLLSQARRWNESEQLAEDQLSSLTAREEEILAHVSTGLTNKEIARNLHLSDKTVKRYMTNIMQKLHVRNRVEAVLARRKANAARELEMSAVGAQRSMAARQR